MTAQDLIIRITRKQVADLFEAARAVPADRLTWKPTPSSRSVLDQLQEVATAVRMSWQVYETRKMEWQEDSMEKWIAERSQHTDIDVLEKLTYEDVDKLEGFLKTFPDSDFDAKVELPFPGDFRMLDILIYDFWNISYHEGQINYIRSLIEGGL